MSTHDSAGGAVLEVDGASKSYGSLRALDGVSLAVRPGEFVALLGPNGAGKTTSFYMIVGLVASEGGSIHLNKEDLTRMPMDIRARQGLGYLPQEASVFRKLTVAELSLIHI